MADKQPLTVEEAEAAQIGMSQDFYNVVYTARMAWAGVDVSSADLGRGTARGAALFSTAEWSPIGAPDQTWSNSEWQAALRLHSAQSSIFKYNNTQIYDEVTSVGGRLASEIESVERRNAYYWKVTQKGVMLTAAQMTGRFQDVSDEVKVAGYALEGNGRELMRLALLDSTAGEQARGVIQERLEDFATRLREATGSNYSVVDILDWIVRTGDRDEKILAAKYANNILGVTTPLMNRMKQGPSAPLEEAHVRIIEEISSQNAAAADGKIEVDPGTSVDSGQLRVRIRRPDGTVATVAWVRQSDGNWQVTEGTMSSMLPVLEQLNSSLSTLFGAADATRLRNDTTVMNALALASEIYKLGYNQAEPGALTPPSWWGERKVAEMQEDFNERLTDLLEEYFGGDSARAEMVADGIKNKMVELGGHQILDIGGSQTGSFGYEYIDFFSQPEILRQALSQMPQEYAVALASAIRSYGQHHSLVGDSFTSRLAHTAWTSFSSASQINTRFAGETLRCGDLDNMLFQRDKLVGAGIDAGGSVAAMLVMKKAMNPRAVGGLVLDTLTTSIMASYEKLSYCTASGAYGEPLKALRIAQIELNMVTNPAVYTAYQGATPEQKEKIIRYGLDQEMAVLKFTSKVTNGLATDPKKMKDALFWTEQGLNAGGDLAAKYIKKAGSWIPDGTVKDVFMVTTDATGKTLGTLVATHQSTSGTFTQRVAAAGIKYVGKVGGAAYEAAMKRSSASPTSPPSEKYTKTRALIDSIYDLQAGRSNLTSLSTQQTDAGQSSSATPPASPWPKTVTDLTPGTADKTEWNQRFTAWINAYRAGNAAEVAGTAAADMVAGLNIPKQALLSATRVLLERFTHVLLGVGGLTLDKVLSAEETAQATEAMNELRVLVYGLVTIEKYLANGALPENPDGFGTDSFDFRVGDLYAYLDTAVEFFRVMENNKTVDSQSAREDALVDAIGQLVGANELIQNRLLSSANAVVTQVDERLGNLYSDVPIDVPAWTETIRGTNEERGEIDHPAETTNTSVFGAVWRDASGNFKYTGAGDGTVTIAGNTFTLAELRQLPTLNIDQIADSAGRAAWRTAVKMDAINPDIPGVFGNYFNVLRQIADSAQQYHQFLIDNRNKVHAREMWFLNGFQAQPNQSNGFQQAAYMGVDVDGIVTAMRGLLLDGKPAASVQGLVRDGQAVMAAHVLADEAHRVGEYNQSGLYFARVAIEERVTGRSQPLSSQGFEVWQSEGSIIDGTLTLVRVLLDDEGNFISASRYNRNGELSNLQGAAIDSLGRLCRVIIEGEAGRYEAGTGQRLVQGTDGSWGYFMTAEGVSPVWMPVDPSLVINHPGGTVTHALRPVVAADASLMAMIGQLVAREQAQFELDGDNSRSVGADNAILYGRGGDDTLTGDARDNHLDGGAGNDVLNGDAGIDWLYGQVGNDTMAGGDGADILYGGEGSDSLSGGAGNDTFFAGLDNDDVRGDAGDDIINGQGGDDTLFGGAGTDSLIGGFGNDMLIDTDNDALDGGPDNDVLAAGQGNNDLDGASGDDVILADLDHQTLTPDAGVVSRLSGLAATARAATAAAFLETYGAATQGGADTIRGGYGDDRIAAGGGADLVAAGEGADIVVGAAGNDTLDGGLGADTLYGGAGDDILMSGLIGVDPVDVAGVNPAQITNYLDGGDGNDVLLAGSGRSVLVGGAGSDVFYLHGKDGAATVEIRDMQPGEALLLDAAGEGNGTTLAWEAGAAHPTLLVTFQGGVQRRVVLTNADASRLQILSGGQYGVHYLPATPPSMPPGATPPSNGALPYAGPNAWSLPSGRTLLGAGSDDRLTASGRLLGEEGNDILTGGASADTIEGGAGYDKIIGGGGADVLRGDEDGDEIRGQAGADTIDGGSGNDKLEGGDDGDLINGGSGIDVILGQKGDDVLDGGAGNDDIAGNEGADTIYGGDGDDRLDGQGESTLMNDYNYADVIHGGAGNDYAFGGVGNDTITGGTGNDTILGGNDDDTLSGDDGNDSITGGTGNDDITGGTGNDIILGGAGNDRMAGNEGNDHLSGEDGDDTLNGDLGDDTLNGGTGNDTIFSSVGRDSVDGDTGNDLIYAGADNDTVRGGGGHDVIDGESGGDHLFGNGGNDTIYGGLGDDAIRGDTSEDPYANDADAGADRIDAGAGNDYVAGGGGDDVLIGGADNDTMQGGHGQDSLTGDDGNDWLEGDFGNDTLDGGNGNDTVNGGGENDIVRGGAGDDLVFGWSGDDTLVGGAGRDVIYGGVNENDGGEGVDTVSYAEASGGFYVNLAEGRGQHWEAEGDRLFGVENLIGSRFNDYLVGQERANPWGTVFDVQRYLNTNADIRAAFGNDLAAASRHWLNAGIYEGRTGGMRVSGSEIDGGSGDDVMFGGSQDDYLLGNTGNDSMNGGRGNDYVYGGAGNDTANGGDGNDFVHGGDGNDWAEGNGGNDTIRGGTGNDTLGGGDGDDILNSEAGNDQIHGGEGNDQMDLGDGDDSAWGNAGNDSIYGRTGNDYMEGLGGDDFLFGDDGDDTLVGGDGNDTLYGGRNTNIMWGGAGADRFYMEEGQSAANIIKDFAVGDTLVLAGFYTRDKYTGDITFKKPTITREGNNTRVTAQTGYSFLLENFTNTSYLTGAGILQQLPNGGGL